MQVKQLPLLATIAAMVLLAISSNADWLRVSAIVTAIVALIVFLKANLNKSDR